MKHTPLVSVIVTTKNRHDLLPRAIESVLTQTMPDLEIVVVDDGSEEPARYRGSDSRVRVIRNEHSKGISGARNVGFRATRGEYLSLLDDDDWYFPDKIAKQLKYLQNNPEIDLVFSSVLVQDGQGRRRRYPEHDHVHDWRINMLAFNVIHTSSALYRRKIGEAIPFEESLPRYTDTLFFSLATLQFKTAYLPMDSSVWMQDGRPDQLTRRFLRRNYDAFRIVCDSLRETINKDCQLARRYYSRLGFQALRVLDYQGAARCSWKIIRACWA